MKIIIILILLTGFLASIHPAHASGAKLYLLTERKNFETGEEFYVDIKVKTDEVLINAAQATVQFPKGILELTGADKTGSVFAFWVDEPTISNEEGMLKFMGGTAKNVAGDSLQTLRLRFKTIGIGQVDITISDAIVTAGDGKGTNVLSSIEGITVLVGPEVIQPPVPAPVPAMKSPVPEPQRVERAPVLAKGLPQKPKLEIPFYPNESKWYGHLGETTVFWEVPDEIIQIATVFDRNPNTVPLVAEKILSTGKKFSVLEDGIRYIHVRFRNNIGWGPVARYRIAVDTQPPLSFKLNIKTGIVSDNPSPVLLFNTNDALSGLDYYSIRVNLKEEIKLPLKDKKEELVLESLPPGKHIISVIAVDKAGNSVSDKVEVEVLPIQTPEITYILDKIRLGTEERFNIKGLSIPSSSVILAVKDKRGFLVFQKVVSVNGNGEWKFELAQDLRRGDYFVTAQAKDLRGAVSLPIDGIKIKVIERPIASIAGIDITLRELAYILLVVLIVSGSYFWRREISHFALAHREAIIITRDLKNSLDGLRKGVTELSGILQKNELTETDKAFYKATIKKLEETIEKSEKYIGKDIEKMK